MKVSAVLIEATKYYSLGHPGSRPGDGGDV
jgi:hypothetical protein